MTSIDAALIRILDINNACQQGFPCAHMTRIILLSGEERSVLLNGLDIRSLMSALPSEKIYFGLFNSSAAKDHFRALNEATKSFWRTRGYEIQSASDVLGKLFFEKNVP